MQEKKKKLNMVRFITIVLIAVTFYTVGAKVIEFLTLQSKISYEQKINATLKQEEETLNKEIAKLNDKNYLSTYASGRIFATSKGEEIYILGNEDTPE